MAGLRQKVFESNNKGLFDIAIGEGNISSDYATELQNARVAINGEVSKRRGRTLFNSVAIGHAAGNSIDTYASSNKDSQVSMYSANNEQVGFAFTLAADQDIQSVAFYLDKVGTMPTDSIIKAKLYAATGTVGTSGLPTGDILATSISTLTSVLTGTFAFVELTFEAPYSATAGDYAVLLEFNSGSGSNYVRIGTDSSAHSHSSNAFATDTINAGWAADTSFDVIFKLNSAGPNVDSLMVYEGDYPDGFEVLAQADSRLLRYTASTGAFDTVIKTGLTTDNRLNWTMFRTKLCMTNGVDNPFKYGYMPKPGAPTTGTTASGTKGGRTYYVAVTYITANGESVPSEETTQVIAINNVLTVTSPISLVGATGWNVYHHTLSGALKLQNVSPIAIGTDYTETTGALNDGAVTPTANTAWHVTDLADIPPKGKYIIALNNRLWISGVTGRDTKLTGSAVDDEDDWTTASDFVDIDLAGVLARGDSITGLGRLGQSSKLIVGLKNHIVTYSAPAVFSDIAIDKIVYNTGVMGHRAMDEVGLDNYLVEPEGVNSIKAELIIQGLRTKKLSDNIRDRLNPLLKAVTDQDSVNVVNNKKNNEFWVNIPTASKRFVYDYSIKAWTEDRDIQIFQSVRTPDGDILSAGGNGRVYLEYTNSSGDNVYGDGGDNIDVNFRWDTPWLWLNNIGVKKIFKYFQFKGSGAAGVFKLEVFFDFDATAYSTFYLQSLPSKWGAVEWDATYYDFPDVSKVLIPMVGMGKAVKFSFTANHVTDISIAFYGVKYVLSGHKAND